MEKQQQQVGCMAGLLQIFDRQQFVAGKRVYAATKRLASSPPPAGDPIEDLPSPEKKEQNATTEGVKSPWKFRECPRLSLDSQAIIDNKGSVYPRPREIRTKGGPEEQENEKQRGSPGVVARLMGLDMMPTREPLKKQPELRRSNSDSTSNSTHLIQQPPLFPTKKTKFETQDFYRQVKEKGVVYGELEKRLKVRGISQPVEDLESLNQILQALQLKGLLHSRRRNVQHNITNRNFFDQKSPRPSSIGNQSPPSNLRSKTTILRPPTPSRLLNKSLTVSENERRFSNSRAPEEDRSERSPSRRNKPVETRRRRNDSVHSPKIITPSPRNKNSSDKVTKSPRNNTKSLSLSPTKIQPPGRFKAEDYKQGKSLLERCDKLLNSIAEIESQPSPVSVLDSSFYKDELSPLKPCIELKDQSIELEEHNWSPLVSSVRLNQDDADFEYVWKIVQASNRGYVKSDLFLSLEKESHNSKCSLHRKLVFDTILEILDKKKQLPPPKATGKPSFRQVWSDYSKIREPPPVEEDMFEVVCRVLIKDLAISGWGNWGIEKSEMVLDIERLIFKDLVGDTIQELATFRKCTSMVPKKLVF